MMRGATTVAPAARMLLVILCLLMLRMEVILAFQHPRVPSFSFGHQQTPSATRRTKPLRAVAPEENSHQNASSAPPELTEQNWRGRLEVAEAERRLVETAHRQALQEVRDLETRLQLSRQRHLEEFSNLQEALEAQVVKREADRQAAAAALETLRSEHARALEVAHHQADRDRAQLAAEHGRRLKAAATELQNLEARQRATLALYQETAERLRELEGERNSLRRLIARAWRLVVVERVGARLSRVWRRLVPSSRRQRGKRMLHSNQQQPKINNRSSSHAKRTGGVILQQEEYEDAFQ